MRMLGVTALCLMLVALDLPSMLSFRPGIQPRLFHSLSTRHQQRGGWPLKGAQQLLPGGSAMLESESPLELMAPISPQAMSANLLQVVETKKSKHALLRKGLSFGIIPLAAAIGYFGTPSQRLPIRLAGAAAGGAIGMAARKFYFQEEEDEEKEVNPALSSNVEVALAAVEHRTVCEMNITSLIHFAETYNVPEREINYFLAGAFGEAVLQCVRTANMEMDLLIDFVNYAEECGLSFAVKANGFALAALKLSDTLETDARGMYTDDYPMELVLYAAQISLLAHNVIGPLQGYYGKRVAAALSFFPDSFYSEIITYVFKPLFVQCVDQVLANPWLNTKEQFADMRRFMTVPWVISSFQPENMDAVIKKHLVPEINLAANCNTTTRLAALKRLDRLHEVLRWDTTEFTTLSNARLFADFEKVAKDLIAKVKEKPELAAELAPVLYDEVHSSRIPPMVVNNFLIGEMQNISTQFKHWLRYYIEVRDDPTPFMTIYINFPYTYAALKTLIAPVLSNVNGLPPQIPGLMTSFDSFQLEHRAAMLSVMLLKDGIESPAIPFSLFGLGKSQMSYVKTTVAEVKCHAMIRRCLDENTFDEEHKAAYMAIMKNTDLQEVDDYYWTVYGRLHYKAEVTRVANSRDIPTAQEMDRLKKVKAFVSCDDDTAEMIHFQLFNEKYTRALKESMVPTGIIADEFVAGLDKLRDRLGLRKDHSIVLLAFLLNQQLFPVVKDLIESWKSETDPYHPKKPKPPPKPKPAKAMGFQGIFDEKEKEEEVGSRSFMQEAINVADCVSENLLHIGADISQLDSLPVTMVGNVTDSNLVNIYEYFVSSRLVEQDGNLLRRYFHGEDAFAKLLGIDEESQQSIKERIARTTFKTMFSRLFEQNSTMETSDLQEFAMISHTLNLNEQLAKEVFLNESKIAIQKRVRDVRYPYSSDAQLDAETARILREQILNLGHELTDDTGLRDDDLIALFAVEAQNLFAKDRLDEARDLQEVYQVPPQVAAYIVEFPILRYLDTAVHKALDAATYSDHSGDEAAVLWTDEVLKYADCIRASSISADGTMYNDAHKEMLIACYLTALKASPKASSVSPDEVAEKLREFIKLDVWYKPREPLSAQNDDE